MTATRATQATTLMMTFQRHHAAAATTTRRRDGLRPWGGCGNDDEPVAGPTEWCLLMVRLNKSDSPQTLDTGLATFARGVPRW